VSSERLVEVKKGIADWKKAAGNRRNAQTCASRLDAVLKTLQREVELLVQPAQ